MATQAEIEILIKARNEASAALKRLEVDARSMGSTVSQASGQAANGLESLNRTAIGAHNSFSRLALLLTGGIAVGLAAVGLSAIKLAGDLEQAQVAFTTMLGSAQKATDFLKELQDFAARTPFQFPQLRDNARQLLAMGFAAEEVIPMMTGIGNAISGLGGGEAALQGVVRALGQMRAAGKVNAQDMLQLVSIGIPAWEILAKAIGTDIPTAMKQAENGAIAAGPAIAAFIDDFNKRFPGMMEKQSRTLLGIWSNTRDNLTAILTEIGAALIKTFGIKDLLNSVNDALGPLVERMREVGAIQALKELVPPEVIVGVLALAGALAGALVAALLAVAAAAGITLAALSPFIVIGAAVAATLALLYLAFQNNFLGIQDIVSSVFSTIGPIIGNAMSIAQDLVFGATQAIAAAWTALESPISSALSTIQSIITTVWTTIGPIVVSALNAIVTPIVGTFLFIVGFLDENGAAILEIVTGVWDSITKSIANAADAIAGLIADWGPVIISTVEGIWATVLEITGAVWDAIVGIVEVGAKGVGSLITSLGNAINAVVPGFLDAGMAVGRALIGGIAQGIAQMSIPIPTFKAAMTDVGGIPVPDISVGVKMVRLSDVGAAAAGAGAGALAAFPDIGAMISANIAAGSAAMDRLGTKVGSVLGGLRETRIQAERAAALSRSENVPFGPAVKGATGAAIPPPAFGALPGGGGGRGGGGGGAGGAAKQAAIDIQEMAAALEAARAAVPALSEIKDQLEAVGVQAARVKLSEQFAKPLDEIISLYPMVNQLQEEFVAQLPTEGDQLKAIEEILRTEEQALKGATVATEQFKMSTSETISALILLHPAVIAAAASIALWNAQIESVNLAIQANQDQLKAAQAELKGMQDRLQGLNTQLGEAKQRFDALQHPRLLGMGELEDKLFAIEQHLKRLKLSEQMGVPLGAIIKQFPLLNKGMEQWLGTLPETEEGLQGIIEQLKLQQSLKFDDSLRELGKVAQGTQKEMTFDEARQALMQTKELMASLTAAISSQEQAIKNQEKVIEAIQQRGDALNKTLAEYQKQLALAQEQQKLVNEALQVAFKWFVDDRQKIAELGDEVAEQASAVDTAMSALLSAVDSKGAGATASVASALKDAKEAYAELLKFLAENPITIPKPTIKPVPIPVAIPVPGKTPPAAGVPQPPGAPPATEAPPEAPTGAEPGAGGETPGAGEAPGGGGGDEGSVGAESIRRLFSRTPLVRLAPADITSIVQQLRRETVPPTIVQHNTVTSPEDIEVLAYKVAGVLSRWRE